MVVEPVVVIPDILSKKASLNDKEIGDNINGIDPVSYTHLTLPTTRHV